MARVAERYRLRGSKYSSSEPMEGVSDWRAVPGSRITQKKRLRGAAAATDTELSFKEATAKRQSLEDTGKKRSFMAASYEWGTTALGALMMQPGALRYAGGKMFKTAAYAANRGYLGRFYPSYLDREPYASYQSYYGSPYSSPMLT